MSDARQGPPPSLPASFLEIWQAVAAAAATIANRQQLARRLGVSTATLQRLLVSGAVPPFDDTTSRRERHAWVGTLTRLAIALGHEPQRWIEAVGLAWDDTVAAVSARARERFVSRSRAAPTAQTELRRELRAVLTEMVEASPFVVARSSSRVAVAVLPDGWRRAGPAPGHGGHCRSCLADLHDPHNHGPSDHYCRWCSDDRGRLRARREVHDILAAWLAELSGGLEATEARRRAALYMRAMPAWASDPESNTDT